MIYTHEIINLSQKLIKATGNGNTYPAENIAFDYTNCDFVGEAHAKLAETIEDIVKYKFNSEYVVVVVGPMHLTILQSAAIANPSGKYSGILNGRAWETIVNSSEDDIKKGAEDVISMSRVVEVGLIDNAKILIDPHIGASEPVQIFSADLTKLVEIFIDQSTVKFF